MEKYVVSARKYRPQNFQSVVGQAHITNTLLNAIKSKHVAQSYLFCGPRGVGKTTCARVLAKTLNCLTPLDNYEACDSCIACLAFLKSQSYNIHELDAASNNSVEDIRNLIDKVHIKPQVGKYSIFIIDEVHMLSLSAFNAFLKTLEEPPQHVVFILATTEKNKIIPTILSRCQIYDFKRISVSDIVQYLAQVAQKESIKVELSAINVIARKSDGSLRDALSFFDQIVSFSNNQINYKSTLSILNELDYEYYFSLTDNFLANNSTESLLLLDEILYHGFDIRFFIQGLASHLRDILVCKDEATLHLLELEGDIKKIYIEQAKLCSLEFLYNALEVINQFDVQYKDSPNKRFLVELMLLKLSKINELKANQTPKNVVEPPQIATSAKARETKLHQPTSAPPKNKLPIERISIKRESDTKVSIEEKDKKQPIDSKNTSTNFSQSSVRKLILDFIKQEKLNPRISTTLSKYPPKVLPEENSIRFQIDNDLQIKEFNKIKAPLLHFLKQKLNSNSIEIFTYRICVKKKSKKPYTDEEKFEYMSKKNKLLLKLRDDFQLDFE